MRSEEGLLGLDASDGRGRDRGGGLGVEGVLDCVCDGVGSDGWELEGVGGDGARLGGDWVGGVGSRLGVDGDGIEGDDIGGDGIGGDGMGGMIGV